jgi:hypothetical protein
MAQAPEFLLLPDSDRKVKCEQQQQESDDQDDNSEEPVVIQQPNEMTVLLQQLLAKQDLLLDRNRQIKEEMTAQQITINNLSQAVDVIQRTKTLGQSLLPTAPSSLSTTAPSPLSTTAPSSLSTTAPSPPLTLPLVMNAASSLKEQAAKQLQSKRINQLLDSTPFTGSSSQEVSDWIDDFSNKCDQVQLDDDQRLSVAIDLLKGNAKLWYDTHKDTLDSWVALKNKLTAYFQLVTGTDQFQLEQKLYNRRRQTNELAIDYCHNVLKLCSKVNKNMDDETRLKHLTNGLNAVTQIHMDLKSPATTEKFLQALIKYDKWQEEEKSQERIIKSSSHHRNTSTRRMQQPIMQQHQQQYSSQQHQQQYSSQQHQPSYHSQQEHQPQYSTQDSTQTRYNEKTYSGCWTCGDMDHYQYECPKNY